MIELWARGNNIWRQLEFSPPSSSASASAHSDAAEAPRIGGDGWGERDEEEEEVEPRDLEEYGKVFEADSVEWVGSDGFGCAVRYNSSSYATAGSPTPFLLLSVKEGDEELLKHPLVERHAQALQRNGMRDGWAVSGTGMIV
ncbi:hypothetical protein V491_08691, partial [Pseudogymnoascus sp. VKM F-3775]